MQLGPGVRPGDGGDSSVARGVEEAMHAVGESQQLVVRGRAGLSARVS
jgi:hypothetical protein